MKKSLARKLSVFFAGIVFITCIVLVGLTVMIFGNIEDRMKDVLYENTLQSYKTEVKSEVQSAISSIEYYYNLSDSGKIDETTAKKDALEALRNLRYGDDDSGYFWVDDTDYKLVMHPILPEQEGTNRYDLTDKNGVKIIQSIMKTAESGGGFNEFYFTKSDGKTVAPKVAYSKKFDKWNWVITTGIYSDDIQEIVNKSDGLSRIVKIFSGSANFLIVVGIVLVLVMLVSSYVIIKRLVKVIEKVRSKLESVAHGDLSSSLDEAVVKRADELGQMVENTNIAIGSFRGSISKAKDTADMVKNNSDAIKDKTETALSATSQVAKAIEHVATDVTNQADLLGEIVKNVGIMSESGVEMSDSVNNISEYVDELNVSSNEMKEKVELMSAGSHGMTSQISGIATKINNTNDAIKHMTEILNVIEEIASQTDLLSLNASIEAARAGEAGHGFAVVAGNIKTLAENTSSELSNIKEIIDSLTKSFEECKNDIEDVVDSNKENATYTHQVIEQFDKVFSGISFTNEKLVDVNRITKNMADTVQDISVKVTNIEKGTESTAASTEEVTASSQELEALMTGVAQSCDEMEQQAEALVNDMSRFVV